MNSSISIICKNMQRRGKSTGTRFVTSVCNYATQSLNDTCSYTFYHHINQHLRTLQKRGYHHGSSSHLSFPKGSFSLGKSFFPSSGTNRGPLKLVNDSHSTKPFTTLSLPVPAREETHPSPFLFQASPNRHHPRSFSYSTTTATTKESKNDTTTHPNPTQAPVPFHKILIANRGEIARRIIQTCKSQNIRTVAIYSTADSKSPHVQEADEAICVGPTSSSESYLNVNVICEAILKTGADAVHPGYGFLSENATFCKAVENLISTSTGENVKFIGPNSDSIVAMGDKITSKQIANDANVNIIPGYDGFVTSPSHAVEVANSIGYPVMIKATSGGGGKGMRICYNNDQVIEGYGLSTAEAKSFFNDERLFIEKFIENPHHIEIQLLAGRKTRKSDDGDDSTEKGELEILCFVERECSIQSSNVSYTQFGIHAGNVARCRG